MPPTYKRKQSSSNGEICNLPANNDDAAQASETITLPDLPMLTHKQEGFLFALLEGKGVADAYRSAYDAEGMAPTTLWANASKLKADAKISAWLRYFQRQGAAKAMITRENHLEELARGREIAYSLGQASAGIQAEHYRGKAVGLYQDRLQITAGQSDEELLRALQATLGADAAVLVGEALRGEPVTLDSIDYQETQE